MAPEAEGPERSAGGTTRDYRKSKKEARYTGNMGGGRWSARLVRLRGALSIAVVALVSPAVHAAPPPPAPEPGGPFWLRAAPGDRGSRGGDDTAGWFSLAIERTTHGRYAEAAAAYGEALAAGAAESSVYANLGEVLMADGQLRAAEACYRDAIAAATRPTLRFDDPREHAQDLLLALLGLAVALDRDGQPRAAHETMRRALALDATTAVLTVATLPDADLFFVPAGDVYYYLGLARAAAGRRDEAAEAFHEFLAQAPASRWARQAQSHLDDLARGAAAARRASRGPRVMAVGTVLSTGGAAAPLVDAAWREQATILDDCFDAAPALATGRLPLRLAVELAIDARGRVTSAVVKLPAPENADLARCLERAVVARLRLPPSARPTRARTELLVGFPALDQNPERVPNLPP
jgi:tetratricopeptide (TPR) repeat protein